MKYKHVKFFAIILLELSLARLGAQETTLPAGGNTITEAGSVSYSVGQVTYSSYIFTGGSLLQGVQQPYEISITTSTGDFIEKNISIEVFPNPTVDHLILRIEQNKTLNLTYQLQDMSGKLLQKENIIDSETIVNMESFVQSTYFLNVLESDKVIITFKVIKN